MLIGKKEASFKAFTTLIVWKNEELISGISVA
jgi:hypothetical protein